MEEQGKNEADRLATWKYNAWHNAGLSGCFATAALLDFEMSSRLVDDEAALLSISEVQVRDHLRR